MSCDIKQSDGRLLRASASVELCAAMTAWRDDGSVIGLSEAIQRAGDKGLSLLVLVTGIDCNTISGALGVDDRIERRTARDVRCEIDAGGTEMRCGS